METIFFMFAPILMVLFVFLVFVFTDRLVKYIKKMDWTNDELMVLHHYVIYEPLFFETEIGSISGLFDRSKKSIRKKYLRLKKLYKNNSPDDSVQEHIIRRTVQSMGHIKSLNFIRNLYLKNGQ